MDNKMNYKKALNKSTNKKTIKIGNKNYVRNEEKYKKFKTNILVFTLAVAVTVGSFTVIKDYFKFNDAKTNISLDVYDQMNASGYQSYPDPEDGRWDYHYEMLDGIDPFHLLVYMGGESALDVMKHRGYESWDDYAAEEGFENKDDWYRAEKKEILNSDNKTRGVK